MPVIAYPDIGYSRWRAERAYTKRDVLRGAYGKTATTRVIGDRRWEGEFEVPLRDRLDAQARVDLDAFLDACADGDYEITIPFPAQDNTGTTTIPLGGAALDVDVVSVRPAAIDESGIPRGAAVRWVESSVIAGASTSTVRDYPLTGYGHWSALRRRAGSNRLLQSVYDNTQYSRITGDQIAYGTLTTPALGRVDARWAALHQWLDDVTGVDLMRFPVPGPDTSTADKTAYSALSPLYPGTLITAVCTRYFPPERDAVGAETGAVLEWVETDASSYSIWVVT